jgi:hypothetical protein
MASNKPTAGVPFSPSGTPKYVLLLLKHGLAELGKLISSLPRSYRYLNDFSKALASEVRILLQEVGKLRDERRALQQYVLSTFLQHPLI